MSGALIPGTVFPKFTLQYQSNNITCEENGVSKRQEALYKLVSYMNDSGTSFRRISSWLNRSGIKTHRGNRWSMAKVAMESNYMTISTNVMAKLERDAKNTLKDFMPTYKHCLNLRD